MYRAVVRAAVIGARKRAAGWAGRAVALMVDLLRVERFHLADAFAAPRRRAVVYAAELTSGEGVAGGDAGAVELTRLLSRRTGVSGADPRVGVGGSQPSR